MSEPENFLQRWSKRKLGQGEPPAPETPQAERPPQQGPEQVSSAAAGPDGMAPIAQGAAEPVDLTSLPPVDSIGPSDGVSAFLRPGVPPELTRAALRRAWTSDPAIRDFVGLVENGWDFNNPDAMGGFGIISAEEIGRLASHVIAAMPEVPTAEAERHETAGGTTQLPREVPGEGLDVARETVDPPPDSKNDAAQKDR